METYGHYPLQIIIFISEGEFVGQMMVAYTHNMWPNYSLVKNPHVGRMLVDQDLTNMLVNWPTFD